MTILEALPRGPMREVFRLRLWYGKDNATIARELSMTEAKVRQLVDEGRPMLYRGYRRWRITGRVRQ